MMDTSNLPGRASDSWWRESQKRIDALQAELDELRRSIGKQGFTFSTEALTVREEGSILIEDGGVLRMAGEPFQPELDDFGNPLPWRDEAGEIIPDPVPSDLFRIGDIGTEHRGLTMRQPDGKFILIAADDGTSILDGRGNDVLATDRATGYGLNAPFISWPIVEMAENDEAPYREFVSTSSTGWRKMYKSENALWHPRLFFIWNAQVSGGVGSVRVRIRVGDVGVIFDWSSETPDDRPIFNDYVEISDLPGVTPSSFALVEMYARADEGATVKCYEPIVRGMGSPPY